MGQAIGDKAFVCPAADGERVVRWPTNVTSPQLINAQEAASHFSLQTLHLDPIVSRALCFLAFIPDIAAVAVEALASAKLP